MNPETIHSIPGLQVIGAGKKVQNDLSSLLKPRKLKYYALVFLTEGNGYFESSCTNRQSIGRGDLFFLFPGIRHYYRSPPGENWREYWIIFNGDWADDLYRKRLLNPLSPCRHLSRPSETEQTLREIYRLEKRKPRDYRLLSSSLLYRALLQILTETENRPLNNEREDQIHRMESLLRDPLNARVPLEDLLKTGSGSYHSLRTLFRQATGLSPGRYRNRALMEHAMEQLLWTDLPVKGIAYNLGFDDPLHFSRLFRTVTGRSPSAYRRSVRD